jgi:hypothetical protein
VRLVVALLLLAFCSTATAASPPPCWPQQADGTGSLAHWDVNLTGFVAMWYCPPPATSPAGTPWTSQDILGNWAEIPGGAFAAMKEGWKLLWSSTDATRAAMWTEHMKGRPADQDYTSVLAMRAEMGARLDPFYLPQPAPPKTTAPAVYNLVKQRNKVVLVVVGTAAVPTPCDPKQVVNGLMAVPVSAVTWSGSVRPAVVYASCEYASP